MEILGERVDIDINILSKSIIIENFNKSLFSNSRCREIFSKYGFVKSVLRKKNFVLIEYSSKEQCQEAVSKAHQMMFEKQPLRVTLASDHLALPKMREVSNTVEKNNSPNYEIAIIVTSRDLIAYAEKVRGEIAKMKSQVLSPKRPPTTHMMVLLSIDHLPSCIDDVTNNGCLFAIVINNSNYLRNSCTVRELFPDKPKEHRNMPLPDALFLINKEFDDYHKSKSSPLITVKTSESPVNSNDSRSVKKSRFDDVSGSLAKSPPAKRIFTMKEDSPSHSASLECLSDMRKNSHLPEKNISPKPVSNVSRRDISPKQMPVNNGNQIDRNYNMDSDPRIIPLSKNLRVLLQMILDDRLLSVGELDEIANYIDDRRCKLGAAPKLASNIENPGDLKNNILKMLYQPAVNKPAVININDQDTSGTMEDDDVSCREQDNMTHHDQYSSQKMSQRLSSSVINNNAILNSPYMMGDSRKVHSKNPQNNSSLSSQAPISSKSLRHTSPQKQQQLYSRSYDLTTNTYQPTSTDNINRNMAQSINPANLNNVLNNPAVKKAVDSLIGSTPHHQKNHQQNTLLPSQNNVQQQHPAPFRPSGHPPPLTQAGRHPSSTSQPTPRNPYYPPQMHEDLSQYPGQDPIPSYPGAYHGSGAVNQRYPTQQHPYHSLPPSQHPPAPLQPHQLGLKGQPSQPNQHYSNYQPYYQGRNY